MNQESQIPHYRERKPRKEESGRKNHIDPTPVEVNDGHKDVLKSKIQIELTHLTKLGWVGFV